MSTKEAAVTKVEATKPPVVVNREEDAGLGMEQVSVKTISIPYLQLIEALSPQLNKKDGAYIQGAEAGDIFNSVTNTLYKDGVEVVPVEFEHCYVEWVDRNKGGGFVAKHSMYLPGKNKAVNQQTMALVESATVDKDGKRWLPNGNNLVETYYYYCLVLDGDVASWAVISMSSARLTSGRKWNSIMQSLRLPGRPDLIPAIFNGKYKLTSKSVDKNGKSYHVWATEMLGLTDDDTYAMAKSFYTAVTSGAVAAAVPETTTQEVVEEVF